VTKSPSQLPTATAVTDDDVLVGNDGTVTKQFPASVVRAYAVAAHEAAADPHPGYTTAADVQASALGGDLTGTVSNAQLADGAVTYADLASDVVPLLSGHFTPLASGEENVPRALVDNYITQPSQSGMFHATVFTAIRTETIVSLSFAAGLAAGPTPSLIRFGVYEWNDTTDAGTLIHATDNDTTLLSTNYALYTKALSTPWPKVRGTRYAIGVIVVTTAALPQFVGVNAPSHGYLGSLNCRAPRRLTQTQGLTDLPATLAGAGSVGGGNQIPHILMNP
jgi:hypothetical protein